MIFLCPAVWRGMQESPSGCQVDGQLPKFWMDCSKTFYKWSTSTVNLHDNFCVAQFTVWRDMCPLTYMCKRVPNYCVCTEKRFMKISFFGTWIFVWDKVLCRCLVIAWLNVVKDFLYFNNNLYLICMWTRFLKFCSARKLKFERVIRGHKHLVG